MPDPKEIERELTRRRRPGVVLERLRSSRGLVASLVGREAPGGVRGFVERAFRPGDVHQRNQYLWQHADRIGPLFQKLDDAERRRLARALLPGMADAVDAAWELLALRPFPDGMARRPFRCRSPEMLAQARGEWLLQLAVAAGEYDADAPWLAAWAPHLGGWGELEGIGWLLAGALSVPGPAGDEVFAVLRASAAGEHPVGQMGRHLVRALLGSARPEAWEYAERLLLAAQRQEGLRQSILECVDEAHPQAFRRMIRLIREEELGRFSSVVRAMDVWFGFQWTGGSGGKVDSVLERVSLFLDDASAREAALAEADGESAYLALWSIAFEDVDAAVSRAVRLLDSPSDEVRYAAVHLLAQSSWSPSIAPLAGALRDPHLGVAARALDAFGTDATRGVDGAALFDALESLMARLPKRSQSIPALVWPWTARVLERTQVTAAMGANAEKVPVERLLPYVRDMEPWQRQTLVRRVAGLPSPWAPMAVVKRVAKLTPEGRGLVLELLGDASADVRGAAFEALEKVPPAADVTERLIDLLARKPGDLRSAALKRLRKLPDAELLAAADRLTGDADAPRRLAGLELLRDAAEAGRAENAVRERMRAYRASRGTLSEPEQAHLDAVLGAGAEVATLADALGLAPNALRRPWPAPRKHRVTFDTPAARAAVESLAALVLVHEKTEVEGADGERRLLVEGG
ncbi:MAG TPA: hypothetical protein VFR37_21075, partial [Longimicrobium sp.]|nr:hypothetical protein [Longimicrobium sp.]